MSPSWGGMGQWDHEESQFPAAHGSLWNVLGMEHVSRVGLRCQAGSRARGKEGAALRFRVWLVLGLGAHGQGRIPHVCCGAIFAW